ncbi:MAG: DUF4058 family protein [Gemmataceae bacterium]|nr:DUF4058 family protein [Gemmataceae bacterium]
MPLHDWSEVEAGVFHDFHFEWVRALKRTLNAGLLPKGYFAMAEQISGGLGPDVLTLRKRDAEQGGTATLRRPQPTSEMSRSLLRRRRGNRIIVRHVTGHQPVAVVEVVSPSNKERALEVQAFISKVEDFLRAEVHVMVLDVFAPGRHDPRGLHAAVWRRLFSRSCEVPDGARRTMASYESDDPIRAYARHPALGEALPDLPLFLEPDHCVQVPLESTYAEAWADLPEEIRELIPPATPPAA